VKLVDRRQAGILADRYLDIVLGDVRGTALLLVQAPLIAGAVAGVWSNEKNDTLSLYFVLCLSAFFLGAINACREIVKERALFLREKMFNLDVGAYLVSKYRIQLMLIVLQCTILAVVVRAAVPLKVNVVALALVLLLVAFTGTALGLAISAWVLSADKAVGLVPLIVIPQILFSDFVLGKDRLVNWTAEAQKLVPVHWGYRVLEELRTDEASLEVLVGAPLVLAIMVVVAFFTALLLLRRARY